MAGKPGWVMTEVLIRWYDAMAHLTRAGMLVSGKIPLLTGIDLDANWQMAVMNLSAAVEAWGKLPETNSQFADRFYGVTKYRNSIAHIMLDTQAIPSVDPDGVARQWSIVPRVKHQREDGGANVINDDSGLHTPYRGIIEALHLNSHEMVPHFYIAPLTSLAFEFWDDHLSKHPEFNVAFEGLTQKVEGEYCHPPDFSCHVLNHRWPRYPCKFCWG